MSEDSSQPIMTLPSLLGPRGAAITRAMQAAREFLCGHSTAELLGRVGRTIADVPGVDHLDKRFFQASYQGDIAAPPDDVLTGKAVFYLTEQRKLFLDCTAGHYQVTWGYDHAELTALVREAMASGVVWDDHSNIPGATVKRLAERLVEVANGRAAAPELLEDPNALNTVLLGICTGSVGASSALKIALKHHEAVRPKATPVLVALAGNYHGTDFLAQRMRGMWAGYFGGIDCLEVEPNDLEELRRAFATHRGRVAAMFAEPILMNREAIVLDAEYLREARRLCDAADALLVIDEIQTGFWCPEVFMFRQYGIVPDVVVVGKGMTSGLHPLSAILYRRRYDRLAQYDAISTNGNAPLAAVAGLGCLALVEAQRDRIARLARHYFDRLQELPAAAPDRVAGIHGKGLLAGVKFHRVADALEFHRRAIERGLWVRVHAYHEGHST
ncbi:MAG: aminotransferase class III-fold pyridoxal phosphate-dependent enzyme, partial [Thermoguttaceae bacterium]|nr:aminotransferase class III-fold pyridoxal phosphate-dependent enzyme [Thermoguttaceae bacterium]